MATAMERVERLRRERDALERAHVPADERMRDFLGTADGWRSMLQVMAEHPGIDVRNAWRVADYRVANGLGLGRDSHGATPTQVLLGHDEAARFGGRARPGALGVRQSFMRMEAGPDGRMHATGAYEERVVFPASKCEGLDWARMRAERPQWFPYVVNTSSAASMSMFVEACSSASLDGLGPVADWCFSERYGLAEDGDPVPAPLAARDPSELIVMLTEISDRLKEVCTRVDMALGRLSAPERSATIGRQGEKGPDVLAAELDRVAASPAPPGHLQSAADVLARAASPRPQAGAAGRPGRVPGLGRAGA